MKFNWFSCSNRLSLKEEWDEVDSNTGKLVCLKTGSLAQYDTKSKTYYVSNSKKDLACDKGMITCDNLTPIFFTAPRDISGNDILSLLDYLYPKFYGGGWLL